MSFQLRGSLEETPGLGGGGGGGFLLIPARPSPFRPSLTPHFI